MKRVCILALALALLCAQGFCETRESVVWLEGEPESVVETLWESGLGFSFWYDAELLTVDENMSEGDGSLLVYPDDDYQLAYVEFLTKEALGMEAWDFALECASDGVAFETGTTESGAQMTWFTLPAGGPRGFTVRYYVLEDGESSLAAYASWPEEAEEGWGRRLHVLVGTVSFGEPTLGADEPISLRWVWDMEPIGENSVLVDEDGSYVVLAAGEAISGLKILSLELTGVDDEGNVSFETETVYEREELQAGERLVLKLSFPGDTPSYGIEFTDEIGETLRYAISISGMDGTLLLEAF